MTIGQPHHDPIDLPPHQEGVKGDQAKKKAKLNFISVTNCIRLGREHSNKKKVNLHETYVTLTRRETKNAPKSRLISQLTEVEN